MCSERDSPLEPFVLPAPGQPELARLTCGAHLGPPVLTRKQKRPRVNSLVCDRAAAFCAAGPPEALFWMSRLVTQAAKHERELARAHSQRLKQATLSLPGESVSRGFADRGALEGYPSHYTSLVKCNCPVWTLIINFVSALFFLILFNSFNASRPEKICPPLKENTPEYIFLKTVLNPIYSCTECFCQLSTGLEVIIGLDNGLLPNWQ